MQNFETLIFLTLFIIIKKPVPRMFNQILRKNRSRGNTFLEICSPDIRFDQPDIRDIINGYQEKIDQISIKYLTDFSRILKNICWIYLNISQKSVDRGQRKNTKNRRIQSYFDEISQPDIKAFCTPDII